MNGNDSAGVHAIILTRDRSIVLERCVDTAIRTLSPCDALTVLDDSTPGVVAENGKLLAAMSRNSPAVVTHLIPARLYERIADVTHGSALQWQARTAPRDIAPLRNLALLLSVAVRAQMTIFIDDDICGFDLELTRRHLEQAGSGSRGLVLGAEISGQSEMDTLTRLHDAIRRLGMGEMLHNAPLDELFCNSGNNYQTGNVNCGWVSGGYMAFSIPPERLFPFPPGYNEDWLWCLMHSISGQVRVVRSEQIVQHAPPRLRRGTQANVLFELAGDLVFESMHVYRDGEKRLPLSTLDAIGRHTPSTEVLPTTRVAGLMKLVRGSKSFGRLLSSLNHYGLGAVETLMKTENLYAKQKQILPDWCSDAMAKHKSYSLLPSNAAVKVAMAAMVVEGRK